MWILLFHFFHSLFLSLSLTLYQVIYYLFYHLSYQSAVCARFFFAHFIQWIEHIKREKEWERAISLLAVWGLCVGANAVCNTFCLLQNSFDISTFNTTSAAIYIQFNLLCTLQSCLLLVFFRTTKKVNSYANNNNTELQNSLSNHNINIPNASNSFCFEKKLAYMSPKQSIERNVSAAPTICMCHSNTSYVFYGLVPFVSPKFPTIDFEIYDQKEQENKKLVVKHSIYDWDFHD